MPPPPPPVTAFMVYTPLLFDTVTLLPARSPVTATSEKLANGTQADACATYTRPVACT